MITKTTVRAAAAALAAAAVWGSAAVAGPPQHGHHKAESRVDQRLAQQLARARVATAKYATDLERAKADGYRIITPNMPDMGFHYLKADIQEFDVAKPPILVYVRRGGRSQLAALEWVFPEKPRRPPLKGARYGSFPAACHYDDGTFVSAGSEDDCAPSAPGSGAPFVFWHPRLVTLHVWLWYHNPHGLYNPTNPLVRPFTGG